MSITKIVRWKHQANKNGEFPIFIRITEDRKSRYIKTGLYALEEDWDEKENLFRTKYRKAEDQYKIPIHDDYNKILKKKHTEAESVVSKLTLTDKLISSEQVKNEILRAKKLGKDSVLKYIDHIVDELKKQNKIGTSTCYKDLKRSLKAFLKVIGKEDITFIEITTDFLKKYEADFRTRDVKDTGISFYFRSLRAVMNKAIAEGLCKRDHYPFDQYKISKFDTHTSKRAITKKDIEAIKKLEIEVGSSLFHARNIFLFSYYNRGINFSDIAMLKWENVRNNRLTYTRLKTGKQYNLLMLEPTLDILTYYKTNNYKGDESHIFPILDKERHITPLTIKNRIHKILGETNENLKEIGKMAELEIPLTTYVARHTYATVMKRSGVSTSIISEALGHGSERTTQIYLDSFENDVLDEASKAIL